MANDVKGKAGLLELLKPTALPAPPKEPDIGPTPDVTDADVLPPFGLDSIDPRLIVVPEKEVPDSGIITLSANLNFESATPTTLVINQTDPTNVVFTAAGGGGNINNAFGDPHALWINRFYLTDNGDAGTPILNGVTQRGHPYIQYDSGTGNFAFSKSGYFIVNVTARIDNSNRPVTSTDRVWFELTPAFSTLLQGLPSAGVEMLYLGGQTKDVYEPSIYFTATLGLFAANGTVVSPQLFSTWTATWQSIEITIGTVYGPGTFGEISPEIQASYAYHTWGAWGSTTVARYNYLGFYGAPYGVNGQTPAHTLTTTDSYIGDTTNPYWLPDHAMTMTFALSPAPNLVGPVTVTLEPWNTGTVPNNAFITPLSYNAGLGNAIQGFVLVLPGKESYTNAGFVAKVTIPDVVTDHPLYFKYSPEGQNGCYFDFNSSQGIQVRSYDSVPDNANWIANYGASWGKTEAQVIHGNYEPLVPYIAGGYEQSYYTAHIAFSGGTLWFNPSLVTWTVEFMGSVVGYYFENTRDTVSGPASDPYNAGAFYAPQIAWYGSDLGYVPEDVPWFVTPVGYWRITQEVGVDYYSTNSFTDNIPSPTCWLFRAHYLGVEFYNVELVTGHNN